MGDMMELTGLDVVNSFVLLSGIIMIPMNIQMLFYIANGKRISRDSDVICCPLWLCALWIILINVAASLLCARKISWCRQNTDSFIEESMKYYRSCPKYKRFMDNIQWSLKCCGLESFRDWFSYDWYDKIRDYEWDPSLNRRKKSEEISSLTSDSVPLSCCKSGSCISNYLMELGTHSINTQGCGANLHKVIMITLITHLTLFLIVIIDEILLLKYIMKQDRPCNDPYVRRRSAVDVRQIMIAKDNFDASSRSSQINPDDSDEDPYPNIKK
ncbi:peripherin-2-like [Amyelois transitella]|uniref:peripherin-2-like n=1 Tax=Amyelois transitella TaxID=680683 RepID=UPI00298FFDA0|nr:peripherin-2-like [Amyelois transitella]